jgi:hypothetical protein
MNSKLVTSKDSFVQFFRGIEMKEDKNNYNKEKKNN